MIYPFLTATLPELAPGQAPEMTLEEFDALAAEHLSSSAAGKLDGKLPFHREVAKFSEYVAYRSAIIRAAKLNRPGNFPIPAEFYGEVDFACAALATAAPADRELLLDALIWHKLDDLELGHDMDLTHLAIYRMRLGLLQKYARRDEKTALQNFEAALEKLSADFNEP
ncbi:MAG: hypothetical protein E7041_07210 [Lentisphaerae bacterium]|nr:hypothetical protein [Lentisphaerota bacterium]MBQ9803727.1 hypothetical protein [Lentisphaeria bacterium]